MTLSLTRNLHRVTLWGRKPRFSYQTSVVVAGGRVALDVTAPE